MRVNKKNKLLLTAIILTYVGVALSLFCVLALVFNWFNVGVYMENYCKALQMDREDIELFFNMFYFEMIITMIINVFTGKNYVKVYKFRLNNRDAGRYLISVAIWQILFGAWLPAVFAIIAGLKMSKKKVRVDVVTDNPNLNDYKLTAMSEAIQRLKELRDKGAISEEEYYASLNKVLEG